MVAMLLAVGASALASAFIAFGHSVRPDPASLPSRVRSQTSASTPSLRKAIAAPEDRGDIQALTGDARAAIARFGEEHAEEQTVCAIVRGVGGNRAP